MKLFVSRFLLILGVILITPAGSFAQVFSTGPDDTAIFDRIFNVDTNLGADTLGVNFGNGDIFDSSGDGTQDPSLQINVSPEGNLSGNFRGGVEVNVRGGSLDLVSGVAGSEINLLGGSILTGSVVNGGQLNVFGGIVGTGFRSGPDPRFASSRTGGEINLFGGTFQSTLQVGDGSVVNIFGREIFLDGVSVSDFGPNSGPQIIDDRDSTLSGLLSDGTPFSFELNSSEPADGFSQDFFSPGAMVSVTFAVPEPSSLTFLSLTTGLLLLGRRRYI